ncbi:MAG: LysR family transcriptional regulator [Actinobacteria bacterium]|nr:LysR family transcriptional regulator [Actinomycetota bacterium]
MAVTLTQLSAFLTVVRRGSVTAAAEELVVTQPSVSAAVAALEREVGVQLTERAGRNVRPTAAGEAYARYAADVLGLLREGAEVAGEVARGAGSRLRISAVTTAGEYLAPVLIQAFREHHPELQVSLHVGNREEVFRRVQTHEADVAVSGRPPEESGLEGEVFADNEFALITAPGDPLAKRPRVAVSELGGTPWLMREQGSGTRRLCQAYLSQHQLDPAQLTLGSNGAIKNAARVGLGIALQSRHAIQLELDCGLLATIRPRGGLPKRAWYVVRSSVGPNRESVDAFHAFITSPAARHALARAHGDEVQQTRNQLARSR